MSAIVQITDFKGFYKLATKCFNEDLQSYIDELENEYLCKLLGEPLKVLLLADLVNGVPVNTDYLAWFNPFCEDSTCCVGSKTESIGLKNVLTGIIYYNFVHDSLSTPSLSGMVQNENENSKLLSPMNVEIVAEKRWNKSALSFNEIKLKVDATCCLTGGLEFKTVFV